MPWGIISMSKKIEQTSQQRELLFAEIGYLEEQYADTHNPLYVWRCIALVINHELFIPEWVADYLYASANNLFKQVEIVDKRVKARRGSLKSKESVRRKPEHTGDIISSALGFTKIKSVGKSNAFADFVLMDRAILSSILVAEQKFGGLDPTYACEEIVKKLNVPAKRVRDAYDLVRAKPAQK